MSTAQKLSWVATGLCCLAAVLMPIGSTWLTVGLIVPALVLIYIGLVLVQRECDDVDDAAELQERWRRQRDRSR
jgi:4-hydroxybenzoate polyprenyltransferase